MRILLVEHNPGVRSVVRAALEAQGWEVTEAPDASAALEAFARSAPDLTILDLGMPGLDGIELGCRLRALPGADRVPLIALTRFFSPLDRAQLHPELFADYVIKPFEASQLVLLARTYLAPPRVARAASSGRRALVVDDDPIQLQLLQARFEHLGYTVTTAGGGAAALELLRGEPPDVVVADVLMPEPDGFQLCSAIRSDPAFSRVPVVLITSHYLDEADRALAEEVGASAFVLRALGTQAIAEAVAAVLESGAAPAPKAPGPLQSLHARRTAAQLDRQARIAFGLARRAAIQGAALNMANAVARAFAQGTPVRDVFAEALASCVDAAGLQAAALILRRPDGLLEAAATTGVNTQAPQWAELFGHRGIFERIAAERRTVILHASDPRANGGGDLLQRVGASSALLVPVPSGDACVGVLALLSSAASMDEEDWCSLGEAIAAQIGLALGAATSVDRLRRSEARLAEAELRFRTLVESLRDTVFTLDAEQRYTGVYGRGLPQPGSASHAWLGKTFREVNGPLDAEVHESAVRLALAGEHVSYEHTTGGSSGPVHIQTALSPLRNASGEILGVVGVGRDITELKKAHAQLLESDRLASVGMLAAGVAHEINNPLAAALVNLDLVARDLAEIEGPVAALLPSELLDEIADAREGLAQVRQIVRDLRIFSRSEEDKRGPVDLRRVIESSARMVWNEVRHRARLVKDLAEVPAVVGNEGRLGQVFLNLIVNAAQAIPEGQAEQNEVRLRLRADGNGAVIAEVQDTGSGMSPAVLSKLFTPFFTTKPAGVGTGLGLSICHRIVTHAGGRIDVTSEPGRGTTFRVTLPVAEADSTRTPSAPVAVARPTVRGRVLVIDDDAGVLRAVQRSLASDHDVTVVQSAELALGHLRDGQRFDVILCDLMMPQMTGVDFHEELARLAPEQAERIVFLTGGAFTPRARDFLDRVDNQRVEKPFDPQSLRALVADRVRAARG